MTLPTMRPVGEERVNVQTTSIGATPVACYIGSPVRGIITKISAVTQGVITTADCTVTVAVNGVTNANLGFTIPVASAAAGQIVTLVPSQTWLNENDTLTFTPSGASGANIGCVFTLFVKMQ